LVQEVVDGCGGEGEGGPEFGERDADEADAVTVRIAE
jgi:hypothetical protein